MGNKTLSMDLFLTPNTFSGILITSDNQLAPTSFYMPLVTFNLKVGSCLEGTSSQKQDMYSYNLVNNIK